MSDRGMKISNVAADAYVREQTGRAVALAGNGLQSSSLADRPSQEGSGVLSNLSRKETSK
jgi:hypothetical protein